MKKDDKIDQHLIKQVKQGNKRAFDALVIRYQHRLNRLVMRFVKNSSEANDVVQETFIKAYKALPDFRGDSAFYSWLYRIAINTAKNYLVARDRRPPAVDLDFMEMEEHADGADMIETENPEGLLLREEVESAVNASVDTLNDELRTTLILRELAGLSYDEIAEALSIPVGTVRSRLSRAREAIVNDILPLIKDNRS